MDTITRWAVSMSSTIATQQSHAEAFTLGGRRISRRTVVITLSESWMFVREETEGREASSEMAQDATAGGVKSLPQEQILSEKGGESSQQTSTERKRRSRSRQSGKNLPQLPAQDP